MQEGHFTIPTRVFLTAEQREKLFVLAREHDIDLPELLTELLVSFLEHMPEQEEDNAENDAPSETTDTETELRQRRAELRRLRARAVAAGDAAPRWLKGYIADLEREVGRIEGS
jgi:HPt (histidine-containing phosphotransfer) domain-containing protein